jgi:hypothetical protein
MSAFWRAAARAAGCIFSLAPLGGSVLQLDGIFPPPKP